MIDLREKINNEKELYLKLMPGDNAEIKNAFEKGINVALKVLDGYNLITTPKSIKLGEIIDKLNKIDKSNKFKAIIKVSDTVVIENSEFKKEYFYVKNNKIFDLSTYMVKAEYKWLFNLWTTNAEIIDDIGEVLND